MGALVSKIQELANTYGLKKTIAAVLGLLFLKSTVWRKLQYSLKNQPPGPLPLPVIGNFPHLSPPNTPPGIHKDFYRLSQQYGPVYSLWFGNNYGIVLNSRDAFYEALKTKQDDFANRPVLRSFEAITHGQGVAMNNGHRWRLIRTILQKSVTNKQKGVESEGLIKEEIGSSLAWLREECARGRGASFDLRQLCRREALNVILRKVFSFRFGNENTPLYMETQNWIKVIFEHLAQGSPSDFMPIAGLFPNKEEEHYFKTALQMEEFIDGEIERHKATIEKVPESEYDFVYAMLDDQKKAKAENRETLTDVDIRVCAWDAMAGAIDTAATSMEWTLYLLAKFPEKLKKVHEELDRVVGPDRLPSLDDVPNLKYLTAVIAENMRFKHFAPQGLPHEAAVDSTLLGYNVPKGTQVFLNFYSLHMNPEYWVKPEEFRPERFLEEESDLLDVVLHPETYFMKKESYKFCPYGSGRRRCVGYGLGRISLFLKTAMWLHCFDWGPADGKTIDLDTEILGITMMPAEQKLKATPRPAARLLKDIDDMPGYDTR